MNACPRCGTPLSANSSICPRCGADTMSDSAAPTRLLVRHGALAAIAAHIIRAWTASLSLDLSSWYAPQLVVLWILLLALGGYAFWISLGRRSPMAPPRARNA